MSNAELIERLRDDEIHVFDAHEAADALELADKRIAELERKLAVARKTLKIANHTFDTGLSLTEAKWGVKKALAQIGD